jgi:predicted Fe-Mo cluster-binding NifX family protein
MRIAISADGRSLDSKLDRRFGRCDTFIIIDQPGDMVSVIPNSAQSASGGAGIAAAQSICDAGADVVITGQVGPNAIRVLQAAGVRIMAGIDGTIASNLEAYEKGNLSPITESGKAHFGMGGR